jgi:hypothetical protein
VFVKRFGLKDAALRNVAEIVHNIDLKDAKFARAEAVGVDRLIAGIALRHPDDDARPLEGGAALESLYEYFKRKRSGARSWNGASTCHRGGVALARPRRAVSIQNCASRLAETRRR